MADSAARLGILLHWVFRLAVLMEFVGHGAFGIITKASWVPYFGVFGINEQWAYRLMPIIGTVDISMGVLGFVSPRRWALTYCAFWGLFTAVLRPLAGESFWEVLDRGGNYLGPFAFLMLSGFPRTLREWTEPIHWKPVTRETLKQLAIVLQTLTVLILIGHGAYGALLAKQQLADQYVKVGLTSLPWVGTSFIRDLGWLEIALGVAIAVRPFRALVLSAAAFKVATELLYPITGYPIWEFVERGYTYLGPLALFFILPHVRGPSRKPAGADG